MERYMGLFRSEKVQDRGSDMAGLFAVWREAFAAAVCGRRLTVAVVFWFVSNDTNILLTDDEGDQSYH
eukprot:scaffold25119_cov244-Amphora_coffeaeformis.AAC.1